VAFQISQTIYTPRAHSHLPLYLLTPPSFSHFQNPNAKTKHTSLRYAPFRSVPFCSLFRLLENVAVDDRKLQQNPAHCARAANASPVAEEGAAGGVGRAGGARGGVRGAQPEEVHCARHVPEPSDLQDASRASGRRIRFLQPRSSRYSLRWVSVRRASPGRGPTRTRIVHARGFKETVPRGCVEWQLWILAVSSWWTDLLSWLGFRHLKIQYSLVTNCFFWVL